MREVLVNWGDPLNRWKLDDVLTVCGLAKEYADRHGLKDVGLAEVEDNRESDARNQRFDVTIEFNDGGHLKRQKLLILKGEILDGEEFHRRAGEFYPRVEKEAEA